MAGGRVSITGLPDPVLTRILELTGRQQGQSICCVCKRWNTLFFQSPELWRSLTLDGRRAARAERLPSWLAAKAALLRRLGGLVAAVDARLGDPEAGFGFLSDRDLGIDDGGSEPGSDAEGDDDDECDDDGGEPGGGVRERINALLQALPPSLGELRLSLECEAADTAALALPPLPALASLHLEGRSGAEALQPLAAAYLAALPQLEAFAWRGPGVDVSPELAGALGALTRLTRLELSVLRCFYGRQPSGRLPSEAGAALAALTGLRALACDAARTAPEVAAAAARLPRLTALALGGLPAGAPLAPLTALSELCRLSLSAEASGGEAPLELPAPAAFPALRSFSAGSRRGQRALYQVAGTRLSRCVWDGEAGTLEADGLSGLTSWAHLLATLRPPAGGAPLRALHITASQLPPAVPQGCPPLPALTMLRLERCTASEADDAGQQAPPAAAAVDALLRAAPGLEALSLSSCLQGELPGALVEARGITKLDLSGNDLAGLPPGAWLADLKTLSLAANRFTSLPPALTAAAALTALELSGNWQLELGQAAADILGQLKQLRRVSFAGRGVSATFCDRLAAQLPGGRHVFEGHMHTSRRSTGGRAPRRRR